MNIIKTIQSVAFASLLPFTLACDQNEDVPDHMVVGEAYATAVTFSASNEEPQPGQTLEVVLSYANYSEDPVVSVTFIEEIDGGDRSTINTLDESGATLDAEITRTFDYVVPDASDIYIFAEIRSIKEFPQIERIYIDVQ